MECTLDFIERLRARIGAGSRCTDYKLAKVLGVNQGNISNYVSGSRAMSDDMAIKVAKLLGEKPEYVVACCHAERSISAVTAKMWEQIAQNYASECTA